MKYGLIFLFLGWMASYIVNGDKFSLAVAHMFIVGLLVVVKIEEVCKKPKP